MARKLDSFEARSRALCVEAGLDPDSRVPVPGSDRGMPAWVKFRDAARLEAKVAAEAEREASTFKLPPQAPEFGGKPLVFGDHEPKTIEQMEACMKVGNVVAGVICADGHLGYAQPVGGVIAYKGHVSVSGVGFDIGCGNMAAKLDIKRGYLNGHEAGVLWDIREAISFGVGRVNNERVEHPLFDDAEAWRAADREDYKDKAHSQLGTVGSGNHYVDLLEGEDGYIWIGVHFGSRGLGHSTATKYVTLLGGKDGINVDPAVVPVDHELGIRYLAAMELAGRYAYAGREWVVNRVAKLLGGQITDSVHNHHNYAWRETHNGNELYVVRKGATPAFPGQRGFIGGSMGDDAVIVEGVDSDLSRVSLYSTVHGAGRTMGRKQAIRTYSRAEMDAWLVERGVYVSGGDIDESPQAYRRLPDVLAHHAGTIRIQHTLRPFAVAMAGNEKDPYKD
jgi:tRNA-splicing ligase RtcB